MTASGARWVAVGLVVIFVAAAVGFGLGRRLTDGGGDGGVWLSPDAEPAWLDIPVPDAPFVTAAGAPARLSDHEGQIVLLNFWGTWCPPCLIEIPHLIEVQERLADLGGTVIGPAVDSGTGEDVLRFARENGINYPVWLSDYDTAVGHFGAAGYPFTLLIDRDGVIRRRYLGPQTSETLLRDVRAVIDRGP
jgi:thiol-disulfide isomerase/thioredoxin